MSKTSKTENSLYHTQNQWGGSSAPWHEGGVWRIGYRGAQRVVAVHANSSDNGKTFHGTMTYAGEGPIGFKATATMNNTYAVENQWGGDSAPWHEGGSWILGARDGQALVAIDIASHDGGATLQGTITYAGEGPIGFTSQGIDGGVYLTENQWGGSSAPWHQGGLFVIGCRGNQAIVALHATSGDGGRTFSGTTTYVGEGPIGFKAVKTMSNTYDTQNQWGGDSAPWHPGGSWILGARAGQALVAVDISSSDGGNTLNGTITYAGEGPIGFKSHLY